jgi:hypothetical protein
MGDTGTAGCIGDKDTIKPGEKKSLTQCTCPEDGGPAGSGCLVVDSKPSQCTQPEAKKYENYCKTNGYTVNAVLTSSCPAAPTPTPICGNPYCQDWVKGDGSPADTCTKSGKTYYKAYKECKVNGTPVDYPEQECGSVPSCEIPANTPTSTPKPDEPTATPGPQCGADCSTNSNVCDNISGCNVCDATTKTCVPPTGGNPSPTPPGSPSPTGNNPGVPGPQCGDDCTNNPNVCQLAGNGCTSCVDNGSGRKTCQNPGSTPPPPPPGTTSAPTATPTPDFSEAMCKCDGMTVSQIIAGQPAVFTATSKVTGSDVSKAEAKQIEFLLSAGNNPASRKIIAGPQRVNTTASGNATEMKYQAQWTVNIPQTVEKNVDYVAKATIKCTRKTTAQAYPYTAMVLGESDKKSIFSVITDFFRSLFGGETAEQVNTQDQPEENQDEFVSIAERNNLQLGTFAPAKVIENKCPTIKFRFQ